MSIKCGDCGAFIDVWGKCECHDPLYEVPAWERENNEEGDCENEH